MMNAAGPPPLSRHSLRQARIEDVAALPGLEQSAGELFRTLPDLAWLADAGNLDEARYRQLVAGGWCWVAEDDTGRPCAFLAAEPVADELHVCELGVALAHQRQGIGSALLQAAIAMATRHGFRAITLTTFADVAWNAPAYERMGFRRLAATELGQHLQAVLHREIEAGLPGDRRCAMRLALP